MIGIRMLFFSIHNNWCLLFVTKISLVSHELRLKIDISFLGIDNNVNVLFGAKRPRWVLWVTLAEPAGSKEIPLGERRIPIGKSKKVRGREISPDGPMWSRSGTYPRRRRLLFYAGSSEGLWNRRLWRPEITKAAPKGGRKLFWATHWGFGTGEKSDRTLFLRSERKGRGNFSSDRRD